MNPSSDLSLTSHFASMTDPRVDRTKKHRLGDILIEDHARHGEPTAEISCGKAQTGSQPRIVHQHRRIGIT